MKHARPSTVLILDSDISEIRLLLEDYAGVVLDQACETLRAHISQQSSLHHLRSATEFTRLLRSTPAACDALLEAVLAGDTNFFAHPVVFEALRNQALPEILQRKERERPSSLRIWSAGCGSGEEAYSIALTLSEALNGTSVSWNIHIVASDIRRAALKAAERGLYPEAKLQKVPRPWISSYFSRVGDHFLVKPRLRNLITFSPMNLIQANFIGHFDCVFCLDVLPHLSTTHRSALLERLRMFLEPGGYLFVGETEKLGGDSQNSKYLNYNYYRRPLAAAARSGR
jgi:two-component system, chemotaxis family, CheB/CheR fusion protein